MLVGHICKLTNENLNHMKTVASSLLFFSLFATVLYAQHGVLTVHKRVLLSNESKAQTVKFEVPEGAYNLQLEVSAQIFVGKLEVVLYDPKGKKMGKLSLGSDEASANQFEDGKLDLIFDNAQKGEWKVKITPTKAEGQVDVNSIVTLGVGDE